MRLDNIGVVQAVTLLDRLWHTRTMATATEQRLDHAVVVLGRPVIIAVTQSSRTLLVQPASTYTTTMTLRTAARRVFMNGRHYAKAGKLIVSAVYELTAMTGP